MRFRNFLLPLLGTVVLAIMAFLGAGVASAHPGHAHAHGAAAPLQTSPAVHEAALPAPSAVMGAEVVTEAAEAPPMATYVAVNDRSGRELPGTGTGCVGACCDNTHCGGCVKIAFGKASLPAPLLRAWLPASAEVRRLTGRVAEGPNEPPRPFI